MDEVRVTLTVFFEEPFWVGVFERYEKGRLRAFKKTFGAEPKDFEVHKFVLEQYYRLPFGPAVEAEIKEISKNPKKMQREINNTLAGTGTGTKSQQALKLQREQNRSERKVKSREEKLAEAERMFERKQQKKKEKHRGH